MSSPHFPSLSLSKCLSIFTIFIPFCLLLSVITFKLRYLFSSQTCEEENFRIGLLPLRMLLLYSGEAPGGHLQSNHANQLLSLSKQSNNYNLLLVYNLHPICLLKSKTNCNLCYSFYSSSPIPEKTTIKRTICVKTQNLYFI